MSRLEDMASDVEMADREAAIERAREASAQLATGRPSAETCSCGADIPKKRRMALPGVQNCIDCARESELINRRYRGKNV